jgi:hypothetical protein
MRIRSSPSQKQAKHAPAQDRTVSESKHAMANVLHGQCIDHALNALVGIQDYGCSKFCYCFLRFDSSRSSRIALISVKAGAMVPILNIVPEHRAFIWLPCFWKPFLKQSECLYQVLHSVVGKDHECSLLGGVLRPSHPSPGSTVFQMTLVQPLFTLLLRLHESLH